MNIHLRKIRNPKNEIRSKSEIRIAKVLESIIGILVCVLAMSAAFTVEGQAIRFRAGQVRVTVPINSGDSTTITNQVNLTGVTNADLSVSGLPAGASAVLTDTNGIAVSTVTTDTNLWLTVNTTNISEGIYTFSLNASGLDTNGAPVTNYALFVLQAAHIWKGANNVALGVSNAWSLGSSWLGGVPGAGNDVVFTDLDAQTNVFPNGISFSNSFVDVNTTIGSLRFSQTGLTNAVANDTSTAPRFHTLRINPGVTLSMTGTNGLSLMRDYVDDIQGLGSMTVNIVGGAGSKMVVSNANANFAILLGNQAQPTLNMSNLENMVTYVSRIGLAEYQLFPNYRNYNDLNQFGGNPRRFIANVYLPRTNMVTAIWKDPDNYNNEMTRTYAMSYQDSEVSGVGSSVSTLYYLGQSNAFFMDSVCFIRANHATGNNGAVRFNPNFASPTAVFRGTNGGRMSVFTVSDDGGTNYANSNVKATVDLAAGNGFVDLLVDRLYVSRDRTMITSNQTPNVQGDLMFGRGIVDANAVYLGFQEHDNKTNWPFYGGAPYLNYCQGRLFLTNGGTFRVNGNLTLGFTADTNPEGSAQQYNTYGQVTVFTNSVLAVSNIIVDGGLNFVSATPRRNNLTLNQGATMIVTNQIGGAPGLPLDTLVMNGATNTMFVNPARTNILVRNLQTPGVTPSVMKIASLTGVSSFPAQIPLISYESAAPFIVANVSALGAGFSGYILDNQPNKTIDVFITTNPPNSLIWRGNISSDWDTTTRNWVTAVGGIQTNFSIGDSVTFDDSSAVNNINVVGSVVPGQSGTGITVNSTHNFNFSGASGATIAGTSLLVKQGAGSLNIDVVKQGPLTLSGGTITGNGSIGATTVFSNATLNFNGLVNGGLTSTGAVTVAASGVVFGPVTIRGGTLNNAGTISNTPTAMAISGGAMVTNGASGNMYVAGGNWSLTGGSVLANYGTINNLNGRLNVAPAAAPFDGGTYTGTGSILDPDSGLITGIDGRFAVNPSAIWSPGSPTNAIGTMNVGARIDLNNVQGGGLGQLMVEVDFNNPQTNDIVMADKWNNITGMILMTNINPGAGSFASGQVFQIFQNNNGIGFANTIDVNGTYPVMSPPVPAPGLQWGLADFRAFGTISITNAGFVWDGSINGNWDTNTANWKGGNVYSDGGGVLLDDSASGTTTITLTNIVAPIGFILVTNIIPNVSTNIITNTPTMSPGLVVSNSVKNYTIAGVGRISGMTGLYKTGTGTLTLLNTNDFTGSTVIAGGKVVVSNSAALGLNGSGGINNEVFIDGATLRYTGTNASLGRAPVFNSGGATIEVSSPTTEFTLNTAAIGPGSLTKIGTGTLVLSQAADNYGGGTIISDGALRLTAAAAGTGGITIGATGLNPVLQLTNSFTFTNGINIVGFPRAIQVLGNATNVSSGAWSGTGDVTLNSTGAVQLVINGPMTNFVGILSQNTSTNNIRFNNSTNSNPNRGSATVTFDLGTGAGSLNNLNGNNLTYDLGALEGGPNTVLFGSSTNMGAPNCTYSIGANGLDTFFQGRITNGVGTVAITKVGVGTLTLSGNNTYSGGTTISSGKLLVSNTAGSGTGSGAVSVAGGTLGGVGAIAGAVSIGAGGNLAPGTSIGTLTINNSLSLAGTTTIEVSRSGFTLASDRIIGLTSVNFGGTLVVNNVGPDAIVQGNSFQLFNLGGSGNFTSITPALPLPLSWNFEPATGVLSVNGPQPTLIFVNNGNSLTFNWANGGGFTFKLQAQTNSLNANWFDYPGGGTSGVSVPIDRSQGTVFFRLVSTP